MSGRGESSQANVNERLSRARSEDLRRQRNVQSKLQVEKPSASLRLPSPSPSAFATPSSSSARAGLLYLSTTQLAHTEREEALRNRQLTRQVAGPVPPASWQNDFKRLALIRGTDPHSSLSAPFVRNVEERGAKTESAPASRAIRLKVCSAFRHFVHLSSSDSPSPPSLRDTTLCIIADVLNQPSNGKSNSTLHCASDRLQSLEVLEYLPDHMRYRMMDLCGRLAQTEYPLSDGAVQALLELSNQTTSHEADNRADDEGDWLEEKFDYYPPKLPTLLDLSFSTLRAQTFKRFISLDTLGLASSLRILSLAGWGADSSQASLDSPTVVNALSCLRNLESLSFAGSKLGTDSDARATILLRKLGRVLVKLQLLDLSYCDWISAEGVCGVSWNAGKKAAFPALTRLVLYECDWFTNDQDKELGGFASDSMPSQNYVADWHARHWQLHNRHHESTATQHRVAEDMYDASGGHTRASNVSSSFATYASNAIHPLTVSHVSAAQGETEPVLTTSVRCPRSVGRVPQWQWQRVRVLDAVRGRIYPSLFHRQWIDVWF